MEKFIWHAVDSIVIAVGFMLLIFVIGGIISFIFYLVMKKVSGQTDYINNRKGGSNGKG